jgi:putative transposase
MLAQVLIAEADAFVAHWKDLKLPEGRDRVVRHGHGPRRTIQTGVGAVEVRRAKMRDRGDVARRTKSASPRRSCRSGLGGPRALMRCCRFSICAARVDRRLPRSAHRASGQDAPNLSPAVVVRLSALHRHQADAVARRLHHRFMLDRLVSEVKVARTKISAAVIHSSLPKSPSEDFIKDCTAFVT